MAQSPLLMQQFNQQWDTVPTIWADTETTGVRPGYDRCVQIGLVRFENGAPIDSSACLINPGIPIPPEATLIHGITDEMVPPFGEDWTWPWLDALSLVRKVDRYASGKGRHKLEVTCARHGIDLGKAHDASADAKAAGQLFYKLGRSTFPKAYKMGEVLGWQRRTEAEEWIRFYGWLSAQPPRPEGQANV